jgi:signal transduction histidine kinase
MYDTGNELLGQSVDSDVQERGAALVIKGQTVGTLVIAGQDSSGHSTLERDFLDAINRAVLWAALLAVAASTIAVALLSRELVGPLRRLTAAAEAMADGDLSRRVSVRSRDEVGELGEAFNAMAGDLETSDLRRRQMTADIAHELRNPLSIIRGNLEAMLDGVYSTDAEHLAPVYEETLLLQHLVEDLRLLSLAEAGQLTLRRTDVDVASLLRGVAEGTQAAASDKGIYLGVDIPQEPLVVDGDATRLRQVLGNLVGNAMRYTPDGGAVTLRAHQGARRVWISVSDTGPGIPAEDLPRIFDRFYRGDAARDRATGGSGLGLAIAKALVVAHDGTIEVESEPGAGTAITIGLPRAQPS